MRGLAAHATVMSWSIPENCHDILFDKKNKYELLYFQCLQSHLRAKKNLGKKILQLVKHGPSIQSRLEFLFVERGKEAGGL